jgi:hypothetical protein
MTSLLRFLPIDMLDTFSHFGMVRSFVMPLRKAIHVEVSGMECPMIILLQMLRFELRGFDERELRKAIYVEE